MDLDEVIRMCQKYNLYVEASIYRAYKEKIDSSCTMSDFLMITRKENSPIYIKDALINIPSAYYEDTHLCDLIPVHQFNYD